MILQALASYYDVLAAQGKVDRPGWGTAKVAGALCLDTDGTLTDFLPLLEQKDGKGKARPRILSVPEPVTRSSGVNANFLCDIPAYLLGYDPKGKAARVRACFDAAASLHLRLLTDVDSPAARAVCAFFSGWNPDALPPLVAEHADLLQQPGYFIFRIGGAYAHEDPAIRAAWQADRAAASEHPVMQCAVTGQYAPAARLHTKIKGVRGAQSSGAALVSFNGAAFESYGQTQSFNAPVSESAMFAYTTALNFLLSDPAHTAVLGDTTIVAWAQNGEPQYADMAMFACGLPSDTVTDTDLAAMLDNVSHGKPYTFQGIQMDPAQPFYILGLSPNAARLSVRFFWKNTFGKLAEHLQAHYSRLEIVQPFGKQALFSAGRLLYEIANKKSTDKKAPSVLVGGLMQAILNDTPYPPQLHGALLQRIHAERSISCGQAALLKAILLKNNNTPAIKEVCTVERNDSNAVPYVLGRLFAVLEGIQSAANPNLNTTIKEKYFNTAASMPATIFPRLMQLSQAHLRKLDIGLRISYDKKLTQICGLLPPKLPARLPLSEQDSFYIGYYHEVQARYSGKENKEEANHA